MKHKCLVNNPNCENGFIMRDNTFVFDEKGNHKKCACVQIKAIQTSYLKYAGADKRFMKPFSRLENNNIRELDFMEFENNKADNFKDYYTNSYEYIELGERLVNAMKIGENQGLIYDNAKIYIWGGAGTGKSQFASSLLLEASKKHNIDGIYIESKDFYNAVFDYGDKSKLRAIREKVNNSRTKILVIDDLGAEIAKKDNRMGELVVAYNNLIRDFQKHEGIIVITSNLDPKKLKQDYTDDKRLMDTIFQIGLTKFYQFSAANKFRQKSDKDVLNYI